MEKKRCLFCSELVPVEAAGDYDLYRGCYCSPGGYYTLQRESFEPLVSLPHQDKLLTFAIVSGYIREMTDQGVKVALTFGDVINIRNSPQIPVSIEEKGARLLQYLYRHSDSAGDAVIIHPLNQSYNLTYSPTMQELVYIIEKLKEEQLIDREGMTFSLTGKGWSEAATRAGGRKLKPCFVLLAADREDYDLWSEEIVPKLEQCGYSAKLIHYSGFRRESHPSSQEISESKLVIAELSGHMPDIYFDAGYACGMQIPVVWTMKRKQGDADPHGRTASNPLIRPLAWESADELGALLQQRLS